MSNYNGRRAPNVSQYLAGLNTIHSPQEMEAQNPPVPVEEDFSLFTNAEFFDFDIGDLPDLPQPVEYDSTLEERTRRQNASSLKYNAADNTAKQAEPLTSDFSFPAFTDFNNVVDSPATASYQQPSHASLPYPPFTSQSPTTTSPNVAHALPPVPAALPPLDALHDGSGQAVVEEVARIAAEEDKRRRNTAASARFRIKKKQREQALERTAKEMSEKVQVLESKVAQLEMENKWLKSLITEKNESKSDLANLYRKFADKKNDVERSTGERNDGVGTPDEKEIKSAVTA